jgi:hypothetical protein
MRIVSEVAWCLTEDGKRVPMRHPLARFLLVGKGSEIEESELEQYPILEETKDQAKPAKPKLKAVERPPENKAIEVSETKEAPKRKRGRPPKKKLDEPE